MATSGIGEIEPDAAFNMLRSGEKALLIDVRTRAEWSFVGLPDLKDAGTTPVLIEWQSFPDMAVNLAFPAEALKAITGAGAETAMFLCRSGARSLHAAMATAEAASQEGVTVRCLNIRGGFEGDHGPDGHRGAVNGWKALALPWRQS